MPVFVTHFIEHSKGGAFIGEMNEFIVHHYGGHEKDADWETDQKLPFIKFDFHHVDFYYTPIKLFYLSISHRVTPNSEIPLIDDSLWYSRDLEAIWQPPKHS